MAILGLTKLEAINFMLARIMEAPASALDSSGSWPSKTYGGSVQGHAERVLDRVSRTVQMRGWKFNTIYAKKYNVAAPGPLTFGSNVLAIRTAGPTQFRNFVLRSDAAYDAEGDTATFAAGDYFFDIVTHHDFELIDPRVKELVVREAAKEFLRERKPQATQDAYLAEERITADIGANRPFALNSAPINTEPAPVAQPPGPRRE